MIAGGVVVVGLQRGLKHEPIDLHVRQVERGHVNVAIARRAARSAGRGNRTHEELVVGHVDNGSLIFKPGPGAVVVDDDHPGGHVVGGAGGPAEGDARVPHRRPIRNIMVLVKIISTSFAAYFERTCHPSLLYKINSRGKTTRR